MKLIVASLAAVNASPLIYLSRAGYLWLLQLASPEVAAPQAVVEELQRRGPDDITVLAIESTPWLRVTPVSPAPPELLFWDLGAGETAVLQWALQNHGEAIIDDLAARRCAAAFGVAVRGTLGLVLVARKRGDIKAARPVIEELRRAGMYLSPRVIQEALTLVGE